jgi:hypothetical protein
VIHSIMDAKIISLKNDEISWNMIPRDLMDVCKILNYHSNIQTQ